MPAIGTDAERIAAIHALERAIEDKQPDLRAARARRDEAKKVEAERRKIERHLHGQLGQHAHATVLSSEGIYLNGQTLTRGLLSIGPERLEFRGWTGDLTIDVQAITQIETGASLLPARAGVPLLDRLWPGPPRTAGTLILTVTDPKLGPRTATFAGLPDVRAWEQQLNEREQLLGAYQSEHAVLEADHRDAADALDRATTELRYALSDLDRVQHEIGDLEHQRNRLVAQQHRIDAERAHAARRSRKSSRRRHR